MFRHFADRLLTAIEEKGSPVCVGLDPVYARLPCELYDERITGADQIEMLETFCREVIEIIVPIVPAVKVQSAYFEKYGHMGVELYNRVVSTARRLGLVVIGDVKRGDIGSTAEAYAEGHLRGDGPDCVTVNAYFGADGLTPFVNAAREEGKGLFVLVRTSNPSGATIQDFTGTEGKKFYEHIAEQVSAIGGAEGLVGDTGYSCVGAVVGATYPSEARRLREIMSQQLFLVPGYGAQGAGAADCAAAFRSDGTGAIVNASRSVLYAHSRADCAGADWKKAVESAAKAFAEDIRNAVRIR